MARYWFIAQSNPVAGREEEFNDWYWNEHLKDILAVPGVVSGERFILAPAQFGNADPPFKYLAVYQLDLDDPQKFIEEMSSRAASQRMSRSTSVAPGASVAIWQVMPAPLT
jgi:hypothetical protein